MESRPPRLYKRRNRFDRIYIGTTPYGKGIFAAEAMKAHQPVGRVHGQIKPPGYRSEYCMSFREGGLEPEPPYSLVNHSCSPNCELIEWEITNEETGEKVYELWIHTVREIAQDEQLSIDYAWDWQAAIPCLCGSPDCRGWICSLKDLETCIKERGRGSFDEQKDPGDHKNNNSSIQESILLKSLDHSLIENEVKGDNSENGVSTIE